MAEEKYTTWAEDIISEIRRKAAEEVCGPGGEIEPSENEWNAWCTYPDGRTSFVTGGYWRYLEIQKKMLDALAKAVEEAKKEVEEELKRVRQAYHELTV